MSPSDDVVALLVQSHLEGSISGPERAQLEELLREDARLRAAFRDQLQESIRCACWFRPAEGEETARRVEALIQGSRASKALRLSEQVHGRIGHRRNLRWVAWAMAAAAVLVVGWMGFGAVAPRTEAVLDGATAGVRVVRDGVEVAAGSLLLGDDVIGDRGDRATIRYADGTTAALDGPCRLRIGDGSAGKRLTVAEGTIDAEVAHQPAGRPFVVETNTARAEVIGTRFRLATDGRTTLLEVSSGTVRFARTADHATVDVTGGSYAVSDPPGSFAANPLPLPIDASAWDARFDFEDGARAPRIHTGIIARGPLRPSSRWCLSAEANVEHPGNVLGWLMDFQSGLFTVQVGTEITWTYWASADAEWMALWLYDEQQKASYQVVLPTLAHEQWTSATVSIADLVPADDGGRLSRRPAIGDRITSMHITAHAAARLFLDDIAVDHLRP
jgi:hypothetical protein